MKVLVAEKLADSGVDALRAHFDVDVAIDLSPEELADRIGDYDGLLIRSATQVTAELIGRATNLKVVGRAGIGVDNVDVEAATKRGIVVANAPQSNIVAAAEHTMALMLAVARNVPRANQSLVEGRWERSKLSGAELYEKTLGILGFGRIGQLVAARARGFGMNIVAYDPYVSEERYRDLGVEKCDTPEALYAISDFITIHLPRTPETRGILNAEAFALMKDGVIVLNVARGELLVDEDLEAAIVSGKVGGAGLDVFQQEPITEHPLFGHPNVVVTPHLGASTAEAQDRAGVQTAEQVVAALTGGVVSTAVNIPAISAEDQELLGPFVPLCQKLGALALGLGGSSVEAIEVEYLGRIAERDTRFLTLGVLMGALMGRSDEAVNLVNAPSLAEERGIRVSETRTPSARDFSDLVRVSVSSGGERVRVVGTLVGRQNRPHLLEAWGQRFNLQLEDHIALFRNSDVPGMIGRVGTLLGERGVNIAQMVVGRTSPDAEQAVMVLTTDADIPLEVVAEVVALDGFSDGRAVNLG
ncbi:MAG: D-3-phosphoglycerate dehydrogenase / 2-oxoglutarate reductase [Baekduia sp.]|nr:D-3-phosphoglycerate dehydrogenase / 2-oxoglutarate reductase [Baekduia sp.]